MKRRKHDPRRIVREGFLTEVHLTRTLVIRDSFDIKGSGKGMIRGKAISKARKPEHIERK